MSRGLGVEQRRILKAAAVAPAARWRRTDLQQAAWGYSRRAGGRTDNYLYGQYGKEKNVEWWRPNGVPNEESNFSRALRSLERRGLLSRHKEPGCHPFWHITPAGIAEANKLAD